jgi:hypothetical protein
VFFRSKINSSLIKQKAKPGESYEQAAMRIKQNNEKAAVQKAKLG